MAKRYYLLESGLFRDRINYTTPFTGLLCFFGFVFTPLVVSNWCFMHLTDGRDKTVHLIIMPWYKVFFLKCVSRHAADIFVVRSLKMIKGNYIRLCYERVLGPDLLNLRFNVTNNVIIIIIIIIVIIIIFSPFRFYTSNRVIMSWSPLQYCHV